MEKNGNESNLSLYLGLKNVPRASFGLIRVLSDRINFACKMQNY